MITLQQQNQSVQGPEVAAEHKALLWSALASVAGKEGNRDAIAQGTAHVVSATITGDVDGLAFEPVSLTATMTVGHDSERASSQVPSPAKLIAFALGKMSPLTRNAVMRDALAAIEAGEEYPTSECEEEAENFLSKLRAAKRMTVRGSVSVKHKIG